MPRARNLRNAPSDNAEARHFTGAELYGDQFTPEQIEIWYREEEYGYYGLAETSERPYLYEYDALNEFHAFRYLRSERFPTCLAFGCARGDDVKAIADLVDRFIAVEPAEQWWSNSIGGKPAEYLKPSPSGRLDIPDGQVDLVVCLGVLHHIPNVSLILQEFSRCIRPGGKLVIREPISSMGDWRTERPGLTKNERGLPLPWVLERIKPLRFVARKVRPCMFAPLSSIAGALGIAYPHKLKAYVWLDAIISSMFQWNIRYWRPNVAAKFAPASAFLVLERLAAP